MRIGVFLGGTSKEREISLRSGQTVAKALRSLNYTVEEIDPAEPSQLKNLDVRPVDAAFIALHGRYGEDGGIQDFLEKRQIPYTGPSPEVSALCFDKIRTKKAVMATGVTSPAFRIFSRGEDLNQWLDQLSLTLPVIVKPNKEGSTIGIKRVFEKKDLKKACEEALAFDETILTEAYIRGREITVSVLDYHALPIVEIIPKSGFYDFEAKYTKGKTTYQVPASLPPDLTAHLQKGAASICRRLACEGAVRVDYMLDEKLCPYFLEINTIPGMTETSLLPMAASASGMDFCALCEKILQTARLKKCASRSDEKKSTSL